MKCLLLSQVKRLGTAEDGQAIVLVALGLTMLMMMAALGVDIGYLHYQKQQMQKAADAAAIAGATALSYNGEFQVAAQNDSTANGFANGSNGVSVQVHNPPQTLGDPFLGNGNYVEVIISKQQPTFFMKVDNLPLVNMTSRAVANAKGSSLGCIYALDPTDSGSLLVDGNVTISTTCSIYVESNSETALVKHGSSGQVGVGGPNPQVVGIGVVGGYSGTGFSPTPTTGIPPFNDPLGTLAAPSCTAPAVYNSQTFQYTTPGYISQISLSGSHTYQFAAGTYCIQGGGFSMSGSAQASGSGVTFYLTTNPSNGNYAGASLAGTSATSLTAPTSGSMAGILFFQDRNVSVSAGSPSSFDGTTGATFTGALYFPTTTVQFKGTSGILASDSPIIAYELEFKGNTQLANDTLPDNSGPVPGAILVE